MHARSPYVVTHVNSIATSAQMVLRPAKKHSEGFVHSLTLTTYPKLQKDLW